MKKLAVKILKPLSKNLKLNKLNFRVSLFLGVSERFEVGVPELGLLNVNKSIHELFRDDVGVIGE